MSECSQAVDCEEKKIIITKPDSNLTGFHTLLVKLQSIPFSKISFKLSTSKTHCFKPPTSTPRSVCTPASPAEDVGSSSEVLREEVRHSAPASLRPSEDPALGPRQSALTAAWLSSVPREVWRSDQGRRRLLETSVTTGARIMEDVRCSTQVTLDSLALQSVGYTIQQQLNEKYNISVCENQQLSNKALPFSTL